LNKRVKVGLAFAAVGLAVVVGNVLLRRGHAEQKPCNLLLITLDTVRADHLGCYGHTAAATPVLDGLAAEGVAFDRAFANVPMTLPSHVTVMTGLLPPEHGVRVNGEQKYDLPTATLAELLRGHGYQTGAFIAAVVLDSAHGLDRGFDVYLDEVSEEDKNRCKDEPLSAYRSGDHVTDDALVWLSKRDPRRPFFCWVHLYDPHMPYFGHEVLKGTRYESRASYDGEIAFMDVQIGRLLRFLKDHRLTSETLVIAFGDHGEGLGEHGERAHGHFLYESTMRVPLIFSQAGRVRAGVRVQAMVSLVDLFGTVLDLLGFESPDERSGRSLAPALFGREIASLPSYGETLLPFTSFKWSPLWSLTTPQWKYIRSARLHLYDRPADAKELNNLASERREEVERLEKELAAIEAQMVLHDAARVELDAETIAHLEALGYIAGGQQHSDMQTVDYASLHDIEDMAWIIGEIPRLRALGHQNDSSAELISTLKKIVEASPESFSFRGKLVASLIETDRTDEALGHALEYLRLKPSDHDMHQTVATSYLYLGKPADAVPFFWQAIRLKADFGLPHDELAKVLRRYGDTDGAARHAEDQRGSLNADAAEPYDLGVVLAAVGRPVEAFEQFRKAVAAAPSDPVVQSGFALALEQKGEFAEASEHYSRALSLDPDNASRVYRLGTSLGREGKYAEATEQLRRFVELKPDDVPGRTNLGLVLARAGKLDESLEQFAEAQRLAPDDGQVRLTRAGVLEETGRVGEAVADYREAARLKPDRSDWANHLARILATHPSAEIRNGAEAVRLAEAACQATARKDASFLDTLAAAYAEVGRFDQAVSTATEALSLAQAAGKTELVTGIQRRIGLFKVGQPFREAAKSP
jgi:arylsulfatase A-like enzyme/Flp pilus assembly protein TadD